MERIRSDQHMWTVDALTIKHLRDAPGGLQFTAFIDALIRAQAAVSGIPLSEIHSNLRTNLADGGVDTEVRCGTTRPDPSGWLTAATCWQYKATTVAALSEKDIREEIRKDFAKELIRRGHKYRLCVCDEFSAEKRDDWERFIRDEANVQGLPDPEPRVLFAGDLADWASGFPAIVLRFFKPELDRVLHYRSWGRAITDLTRQFVPIDDWTAVKRRIHDHADFGCATSDPVQELQGEAGVGKTRLVYETLRELGGASDIVVYTMQDQVAESFATHLANHETATAILIADECPVNQRLRIDSILRGCGARVRVFCIDNSGEPSTTGDPRLWLKRIPIESVEAILEANFTEVPRDRRRAYASQSGGFVRFAAMLCKNDALVAPAGLLSAGLEPIEQQLRRMLPDEGQRKVVEALSLFRKVGFQRDVKGELESLCQMTGLSSRDVVDTATRLKDVPGFVAWAGRYLYVTPEVVAQIAFTWAWRRWIAHTPATFLNELKGALLDSFLERVRTIDREEVRRAVGEFFRTWAFNLTLENLFEPDAGERFATLADSDGETYVPILRRLVETSSVHHLARLSGDAYGRWGSRRHLVWLAERMAQFPDYFGDAEVILLRLAIAESEPGIANNATGVWLQLFRLLGSGTAVPFADRMGLLRQRLYDSDQMVSDLAIRALDSPLSTATSAIWRAGPPIVGSRIPPQQWQPRTDAEHRDAFALVLALLCELAEGRDRRLREAVLRVATDHIALILQAGFLPEVRRIFVAHPMPDALLPRLLQHIDDFFTYDCAPDNPRVQIAPEYVLEVRSWVAELSPRDLHGRLVACIGKDQWHHSVRGDERAWREAIHELARELVSDPAVLYREINWLCSPEARSAVLLGDQVGALDADGTLLDEVFENARRTGEPGFARGYLQGLLKTNPAKVDTVNNWLDGAQQESPDLAYQLFLFGGRRTRAIERTLHLIDSGRLGVEYLRPFGHHPDIPSTEELREVLLRFRVAIASGNVAASRAALDTLGFVVHYEDRRALLLDDEGNRNLAWEIAELTANNAAGESHDWMELLKVLSREDVARAARLASRALLSEDPQQTEDAEQALVHFASSDPRAVMTAVGQVMLEEQRAWRFFVAVYRKLFSALPVENVAAWLHNAGVEGARRIARHLPTPYVDSEGRAVVPSLTEHVLSEFEGDDRTFREFCAGTHSGKWYGGDIAAQHEAEARVAEQFLNHRLRRIRQWADIEVRQSRKDAEQARREEEESRLE